MFNFLNLGFDGYKKIAFKDLRNARFLSRALENTYFKVLSNIHVPRNPENRVTATGRIGHIDEDDPEYYEAGLPVVAFR